MHGCLSLVSIVICQVKFSATGRSLVQRSPTECGVFGCDREASIMKRPWLSGAVVPLKQTEFESINRKYSTNNTEVSR